MSKTLNFCNVLILKYKREKISTKVIFPYTSTPGKKLNVYNIWEICTKLLVKPMKLTYLFTF